MKTTLSAIHPTAHIDERAEIAEGVAIGPNCVIQGPVTIGAGTKLIANVYLNGPIRIGERNLIYPGTCIGFAPQSRRVDPTHVGEGVVIGDDNILRENVTIHRASEDRPTRVGNDNFLMVNAHLGHDVQVGNGNTISNDALIGGHAEIHNRANLGGRASVHQFCRVGDLAMIGGLAGITHDLPPYCKVFITRRVAALNVIGLRRAGLEEHLPELNRAFQLLYKSGLPTTKALKVMSAELSDHPMCKQMIDFIAESKRGITPYHKSRRNDD